MRKQHDSLEAKTRELEKMQEEALLELEKECQAEFDRKYVLK